VHDLLLVDAPMFHFVMNTVTNGEAYNMVIRGGDWGGLDGVDVVGTNVWIHDVTSLPSPPIQKEEKNFRRLKY
jgi:rhamnogalacturonan hydrolase